MALIPPNPDLHCHGRFTLIHIILFLHVPFLPARSFPSCTLPVICRYHISVYQLHLELARRLWI